MRTWLHPATNRFSRERFSPHPPGVKGAEGVKGRGGVRRIRNSKFESRVPSPESRGRKAASNRGKGVAKQVHPSEVPGIPIRKGRQTDSSCSGESACLASSRGARSENRRAEMRYSCITGSTCTAAETAAPQSLAPPFRCLVRGSWEVDRQRTAAGLRCLTTRFPEGRKRRELVYAPTSPSHLHSVSPFRLVGEQEAPQNSKLKIENSNL